MSCTEDALTCSHDKGLKGHKGISKCQKYLCPGWGSNSRPSDYETDALPTALPRLVENHWLSLLCFLAQITSGWVAFLLVRKTAMSFDKAVGRPSNKYVPRKKQAAVKVPWYAAMIKASKFSWEVDQKAKIFMPRVRLELTAFRLWDWRAAYCATEAGWKPLVWLDPIIEL